MFELTPTATASLWSPQSSYGQASSSSLGQAQLPGSASSVLFIDSTVADIDLLLRGAKSSYVFILDSTRDGIDQITDTLAQFQNVDSVHIVSHGSAGSLKLGNATLSSQTISYYGLKLQSIGQHLRAGADILLYGCDVGLGETGLSFLNQIAGLTGADIAASNNLTGSRELGGDWNLEVNVGAIESALAFNSSTLTDYKFALDVVGYWKFDESSIGTTVADSSGKGNTGTTNNITTPSGPNSGSAPIGSTNPQSWQFDGINDYISVPSNASLNLSSGQFTEALWIYPTMTANGYYGVMGYQGSDNSQRYPGIWVLDRTKIHAGFGDGSNFNSFETGNVLTPNAWNHVAVTFDGTNYKAYVNGVEVYSTNQFAGKRPTTATQRLDIGRVDNYFQGRLDDVRVYSNALSAAEVAALYQPTPDTTAPTVTSVSASNLSVGGGSYDFTVTYSDNRAINISTIDDLDVRVTGPNSFSQLATRVSVSSATNGSPITATYRVPAPGGSWDTADNGTYTLALQASQVNDTSGNSVPANPNLGSFQVNIVPDTTAPTITSVSAPNLTTGGGTYDFTVTYSDNQAINISTIDDLDVRVTGPNGYSQPATRVSVNSSTNGSPITATYRVPAPGGSWDTADNGTYTLALQASQVSDTGGNFVAANPNLGSFQVNIAPTPANLVGYWKFDESSIGTTVADSSGKGNTGTTNNITTPSGPNSGSAPIGSTNPQSWQFDGINDYISVPSNASLNLSSGQFTEALWIYPTMTANGYYGVMGYQGSDNSQRYPGIWVLDRTKIHAGFGDGSNFNSFETGNVLTPNAWNHVAVTFDGTNYKAYVNGVEVYSTNQFAGKRPTTATQRLDIGRVDNYFQGRLDDVRVYSNALSAAEITALYDGTGTIALAGTRFNVNESSGAITIQVQRTGNTSTTATVDYTTVNGTAIAGSDYTAKTGTITFNPGDSIQTITIPILNDAVAEGDETFSFAIDGATGARLGAPRSATISIYDDDGPSTVGFAQPTFSVNENSGVATINVVRRGNINGGAFTVDYTTTNGTALAGSDYTTTSGQLSFASGEWIKTITVPIINDNTTEPNETFSLSLSNAVGITLDSSNVATVTIVDDDPGFVRQVVISGLNQPTSIGWTPDLDPSPAERRLMFIAQKDGVVRVAQNNVLLPTPFIDISSQVNNINDRGLLGIAVDPNFPTKPYVYLLFTYDPPEVNGKTGDAGPDGMGNRPSRLIRVTADANTGYTTFVPGSELVLLGTNSTWQNTSRPDARSGEDTSIPPSGIINGTTIVNRPGLVVEPGTNNIRDYLATDSDTHSIGFLKFAPDGSLFVSNGDGTAYGRVDPRTYRVQDLDNLSGKILRIDPNTGLGLSDNPFYNGDVASNRSKVYDYGLRNPFRFTISPTTGLPVIGDVGWTKWEEINTGRGKNFGWPHYEGGVGTNLPTGGYADLSQSQTFYTNGTTPGYNSTPSVATPAIYARTHDSGAVAQIMGDFYTGTTYPTNYRGALFYSDVSGIIDTIFFNPDGTIAGVQRFDDNLPYVVQMASGPDSNMYYVNLAYGQVGMWQYV